MAKRSAACWTCNRGTHRTATRAQRRAAKLQRNWVPYWAHVCVPSYLQAIAGMPAPGGMSNGACGVAVLLASTSKRSAWVVMSYRIYVDADQLEIWTCSSPSAAYSAWLQCLVACCAGAPWKWEFPALLRSSTVAWLSYRRVVGACCICICGCCECVCKSSAEVLSAVYSQCFERFRFYWQIARRPVF